jgi:hypothetical protein
MDWVALDSRIRGNDRMSALKRPEFRRKLVGLADTAGLDRRSQSWRQSLSGTRILRIPAFAGMTS